MDKVREEFELAWQIKGMDDEGNLGNKPTRSKIDKDKYAGDAAQFAWVWWKRSREDIVIRLPDTVTGAETAYMLQIIDALDKEGVYYE